MAITTPLFNIFGQSPIKPIQKHMREAHAAAKALLPFLDAVYAEDWDTAVNEHKVINKHEHDADKLKRELRLHLPKGFMLPVARTDILELLYAQDAIANKAEDVAGLIFGRRMQIPESLRTGYRDFVERCVDTSKQAEIAINELDELLEAGFCGNEVTIVEKMIQELDAIEAETDRKQRDLRCALFEIEDQLPPIDVMFLYKLFERTGDLADKAQMVGGRLQLLLAR